MERTQAVEFIIRLEQLYLEQRDMKALLAAMAPGVTWIGSGRGEVCCGKQEARRLLDYTDKSLTSISSYLGFSSPSHFSRVFKKYTGMLPSEYRGR